MKKTTLILMILIPFIFLSATFAFSQGIKEKMKERLPIITELKNKGIVGENSLGYLEFVNEKKEKEDVVIAENKDREKVYTAMAQKKQQETSETTTSENVGKIAALSLAGHAETGHWFKNEKGEWYQKK